MSDALTRDVRVQIPVGADYHGLTIDGEFVYAWPEDRAGEHPGDENLPDYRDYLPERANDAYWKHYNTDNLGRVYECTTCGYLTMAEAARQSKAHKTHECKNCKENGRTSTSWRHVYPDPINEDNYVDVLKVESEQTEFVPEEPVYPEVPNHPSHLSRIQNQMQDHIPQDELLEIVAEAVKEARENNHIQY